MITCPTKCTPKLIKKAQHYLDNFEAYGDAIPSLVGLARVVGVRRETLHVWKNENKKGISNILYEILEQQKRTLLNKGLTGEFNSNIAKLILHQHGLHDKADIAQETLGELNHNIKIEVVDVENTKNRNPQLACSNQLLP